MTVVLTSQTAAPGSGAPPPPDDVLPQQAPPPVIASSPAGWFPDPMRLRFWDGRAWTDETYTMGVAAPPAEGSPATSSAAAPATAPASLDPDSPFTDTALLWDAPSLAPAAVVGTAGPETTSLVSEFLTLLLVLALALTAGALVAGIGIALTV